MKTTLLVHPKNLSTALQTEIQKFPRFDGLLLHPVCAGFSLQSSHDHHQRRADVLFSHLWIQGQTSFYASLQPWTVNWQAFFARSFLLFLQPSLRWLLLCFLYSCSRMNRDAVPVFADFRRKIHMQAVIWSGQMPNLRSLQQISSSSSQALPGLFQSPLLPSHRA